MKRCCTQSLILLAVVISLSVTVSASAQGFTDQLLNPGGIAFDREGNLFILYGCIGPCLLTKVAPDGTPLQQIPISPGPPANLLYAGSRLATDSATGFLFGLTPFGRMFFIDPQTLQVSILFDIPSFPVDTRNVYDINTGQPQPFALLPPIQYGDLALYRPDPNSPLLNFYLTGVSNAFAFVMRIMIDFETPTITLAVILSSTGTTAGNVNRPRGVAITPEGIGVTSLPVIPPGGTPFQDAAVIFPVDFPEAPSSLPQVLFNAHDLASEGMTADAAGNIYIATGVVGNSRCQPGGSGALVFIPSTLDEFMCISLNEISASSHDVAVSPIDQRVYMTVQNLNRVYHFEPLTAVPRQTE